MSILSHFTSPIDSRWQGAKHHRHHTVFLLKNIFLLIFIIIVVAEYLLFKSWWENSVKGGHRSWQYAPYWFWYRIGIALIPNVLLTIVSLFLIINPLHHSAYSFHPIFALNISVFMFGLYVAICTVHVILVYSNELGFDNVTMWYGITYIEVGSQSVLALFYLAMMVYSCIAVHKWRMAKKRVIVELGNVD